MTQKLCDSSVTKTQYLTYISLTIIYSKIAVMLGNARILNFSTEFYF